MVPNLSSTSITIRCTSNVDSSIYAEKTISVSSTSLEYFDYIVSDGSDFIIMPGIEPQRTGKVVLRTMLTGPNTYTFSCWYASTSTQASMSAYNNSSNLVSARVGAAGYMNFVARDTSIIYRYEWNLGLDSTGSFYLYNDATDTVLGSRTGTNIMMSGVVQIFRHGYCAPSFSDIPDDLDTNLTPSGANFYGLTVYDENNNIIAEYKPARYYGIAGIYDTVTDLFRGGYFNNGGIICGND